MRQRGDRTLPDAGDKRGRVTGNKRRVTSNGSKEVAILMFMRVAMLYKVCLELQKNQKNQKRGWV